MKYSTTDPTLLVSFEDNGISFAITDRGIGVPAEDIPKLFNSFFRASNSDSVSGTGLGLFIARQFVELHGGHIDVSSQQGQGSTFCIVLPMA